MTNSTTQPTTGRRFRSHARLLALVGAVIAFGLGAAFMSIGHDPHPRDLPIAAVGGPESARALEAQAPDELSVRSVPDLAAARRAIREREIYGAVVAGPQGVQEVHIASAASNQVANFLRNTMGQATPTNVPRVVEEAAWPADDSGGLSISLLITAIILGGTIGVVGMAKVLPRFEARPRQGILPVAYLAVYALVFGVGLTAITAAFGVGTDAGVLDRVLAITLISFAVTASTAGLVALMGPLGSAVASVMYFVLGSQISGGGTAPEFLPPFWSDLGQSLPGGAGTSLLRDVLYFPAASTGEPITVLAAYAAAGLAVLLGLNLVYARRRAAAAVPVAA